MRQSTNAQGDMARTIEAPANQLKVMNAQLKEAYQWLGAVFINMVSAILPYINAVVFTIRDLLKWLAIMVGFDMETWDFLPSDEDGANLIDEENLEQGEKTLARIKRQLRSFDEINLITSQTSATLPGGTGDVYDKLLEELKGYDNGMNNIKMKATEISEEIMKWLGFVQVFDEETKEMSWKFNFEMPSFDWASLEDVSFLDNLKLIMASTFEELLIMFENTKSTLSSIGIS